MKIDEGLYKTFLEEMNALETFRIAYASLHPGVPLDREDPDVRRLIEACPFFARTRLARTSNSLAITGRKFSPRGISFLCWSPAPMSILQAHPAQLVETVFYPKGSEIAVSPESGGAAIFRTVGDLRILPISLAKFSVLLRPDRGFRIAIRLTASFARTEEIGRLSFTINHLNNYESSQMVLFNLKRYLKKASVVFNEKVRKLIRGTLRCSLAQQVMMILSSPPEREVLFPFHCGSRQS